MGQPSWLGTLKTEAPDQVFIALAFLLAFKLVSFCLLHILHSKGHWESRYSRTLPPQAAPRHAPPFAFDPQK